jgi:hypothetical protein
MDFFDYDFDFGDCVKVVLVSVFLLGSVQLHAVVDDRASDAEARAMKIQRLAPARTSDRPALQRDRVPEA